MVLSESGSESGVPVDEEDGLIDVVVAGEGGSGVCCICFQLKCV